MAPVVVVETAEVPIAVATFVVVVIVPVAVGIQGDTSGSEVQSTLLPYMRTGIEIRPALLG